MMFFAPPVVPIPDPVIVERESFYVIRAVDEPGLVQEMKDKGPADTTGNYWGYTFANQGFGYDTRMEGGVCVLVKPWVHVSINTVYPSWDQPVHARASAVAKWTPFYQAMRRHEGEHATFARNAGAELVTVMRNHPSDETCAKLDAYIQHEWATISARSAKANKDLDDRTGHGSTEGVAISW
ncbi:DUF922 domain-containing Zn-dependent protease [Luteibacter aegosomaticola]|uniref:DUF922 domain-containing protein n=1 Tax=Luteibacter aegosomaticola TaxID=2911538 RepID=UPI001FFBBD82|nr:DUF922 domain-containing protein [Luteibacter aegosomaticola]UPG90836.1 DUF922 domain-containing Zn-dependent protease [Luteibacter aegosomaticola]